ncbi:hypothetical protein LCGC14_1159970 [marine sediment metagenome]|uniref:Uncharacterized protein n=1 Tax=marine sediment metagenome TaxID=412755 RepID=A0A0F9MFZ5_9ZZZZ
MRQSIKIIYWSLIVIAWFIVAIHSLPYDILIASTMLVFVIFFVLVFVWVSERLTT